MSAYTGDAGPDAVRDARGRTTIARIWRGATRAEDAESYLQYLRQTGFREYREAPGNLGALALRRVAGGRAEFLLVSFWNSEEAIRRFAGDDAERALFYPEDERFLVERGERVAHFDVVYEDGAGRGAGGAGREQTESHSPLEQLR